MTIYDDVIELDNSTDWERIVGRTFNARRVAPNFYEPIGQKDLEVTLDEPYLVVVVQPIGGRSTWRYGGELRQTWDFPSGGSTGSAFSRAQSKPVQLFVNKPQLVPFNLNSRNSFRLAYDPPTWFRDVIIIIWKYTGIINNFVRDTLFDIGNQVGAGTFVEPGSVIDLLNTQQRLLENIENRLENIENNGGNDPQRNIPIGSEAIRQIDSVVRDDIQEVNRRINDLSNNLSNVLSGEDNPDILRQTNSQTNIEDELI